MPKSSYTPTRTVRIDDDLWSAVQAQAKIDGVTITSVIIQGLLRYLSDSRTKEETLGE